MGLGGRFSEPPIHLLCRRLGYAFREYKAVVSPGDPFLSVICRILEEGGLERLRRRPPKSFFDLLSQMKKVAVRPGAESQRDIGGERISIPPSGWKDPPSLPGAGVISLDQKGLHDAASASPTGDWPSPLNFVELCEPPDSGDAPTPRAGTLPTEAPLSPVHTNSDAAILSPLPHVVRVPRDQVGNDPTVGSAQPAMPMTVPSSEVNVQGTWQQVSHGNSQKQDKSSSTRTSNVEMARPVTCLYCGEAWQECICTANFLQGEIDPVATRTDTLAPGIDATGAERTSELKAELRDVLLWGPPSAMHQRMFDSLPASSYARIHQAIQEYHETLEKQNLNTEEWRGLIWQCLKDCIVSQFKQPESLSVPTQQSSDQLGTQPNGTADVATGVTVEDDTEEEAEDMEPIPEALAQRDPYMRAWVRRNFGRGLVFGQIEAIEIGVLTREVCYYVHYVDGKYEHLSREEVDRYFYAHANASAAIWDIVDFGINIS